MRSPVPSPSASPDLNGSEASSDNNWRRHGTALPSWTDLEHTNARRPKPTSDRPFLEQISTVRFAFFVVILAASFTAYVGHVHATQELLADVQQAQAENRSLHIQHNYLQGAYARKTGPAQVHDRARAMGMQETVSFGRPVPMP
ncbi:hypothetical protein CRI93_11650 [Longimonas halophila]|uniref:Cell division protein FtsL n=1 Tax=Longimonas halophila TaxID=1469170 RepID=A0A2H3NJB2_9BACT|nr:hypothetical protein [Longimonas halophila]PEN05753.1 hypothetical protein CRI93_11650 [Longimonas halophila]